MKLIIEGNAGDVLLERIREIYRSGGHPSPCGGKGRCGKCRVIILRRLPADCLSGPTVEERELLTAGELLKNVRLSCRVLFRVKGEIELEFSEETLEDISGKVRPIGGQQNKEGISGSLENLKLHLAVDLGTTTIACTLIDPASGDSLGRSSCGNGQRAWGSDVVSRIEAAGGNPIVLEQMRNCAVGQINGLAAALCADAGVQVRNLEAIHVAGNTTMLHLLLGCDPSGLGKVPFKPAFLAIRSLNAAEAGFACARECKLVLLPGISAFVGADITSGLLSTELYRAPGCELLVDIGTNGEIVLKTPRGMFATATAAGPAFEGANISCGMAGVSGAVDHAFLDGNTVRVTTIGKVPAVGICGSGLIDLVAALRMNGMLDETGLLEAEESPDGNSRFYLNSARTLFISQQDIRQLQLAKGAVAAGIRVLCMEAGIGLSEITKVHLAGSFGTFLNADSAIAIGLLPAEFRLRIIPSGNTSLAGAERTAVDPENLDLCAWIADRVRTVDLAVLPAFQEEFMNSMLFPEEISQS